MSADAAPGTNPSIIVAESSLLSPLYSGSDEVREDYEAERRFLSRDGALSREELLELSLGNKRDIAQVYVDARTPEGEIKTFRLRRTLEFDGVTWRLRVVRKQRVRHQYWAKKDGLPVSAPVEGNIGKFEYQLEMSEDDPRSSEFERLWKSARWEEIRKTCYYMQWTLPNNHACEIHYDIHTAPRRLVDTVRIEVEFTSEADARFVEEYYGKPGWEDILPGFIGTDVTEDKRYGSKRLAECGWPQG